jgi:queuosine precursor transporter
MTRGQRLFVILTGLFIAFLFMAELTGGKLFQIPVPAIVPFTTLKIDVFTMTLGVIPFPVTFIITDLLNEYYGRKGVRFVTLLGMVALVFAYLLILIDIRIPAASFSPVTDEAFQNVFANSGAIIFASMVAYVIGQLIDLQVFHFLRRRTRNRHIWLRATGSTIISQLIDSFVVIYLAFGSGLGTQTLPLEQVLGISATNFTYKVIVALLITPLIYLGHYLIDRYLGREGEAMQQKAMQDQSFVITPYPG